MKEVTVLNGHMDEEIIKQGSVMNLLFFLLSVLTCAFFAHTAHYCPIKGHSLCLPGLFSLTDLTVCENTTAL